MKSQARLVVTLDLELGWGAIESGLWRQREQRGAYERTYRLLPVLLAELEALELPLTWAVVGGLLEPPGTQRLDHLPEQARKGIQQALRQGKASTFDGRALFDRILESRHPKTFACHGYSHIRFDHPDIDERVIDTELREFSRVFPADLPTPDRLVYPTNAEGFYDIVARHGYSLVRGDERSLYPHTGWRYRLASLLRPPAPTEQHHTGAAGLKREPASLFFNSGRGRLHRLPLVRLRAYRGLRRAQSEGGTLHVWSHPWNLADSPGLLDAFLRFLRLAAREHDAGRLDLITPM